MGAWQGRSMRLVGKVEWSVGAEMRPGKGDEKNKGRWTVEARQGPY